jgi:hypothetical protein
MQLLVDILKEKVHLRTWVKKQGALPLVNAHYQKFDGIPPWRESINN